MDKSMRRIAVLMLTVLASFVFGYSFCAVVVMLNQPSCPTEDSCTADYRDGGWHIEEVRP